MATRLGATAAAGLTALALLAGCGSPGTTGGEVKAAFGSGIAQMHGSRDRDALRVRLRATVARLRAADASSGLEREARVLAVGGFSATLQGIESQLDFIRNDSGNVEAATRDAMRADRSLRRGARLLRAAGRKLGVEVGALRGY
jgi:hypothetical protein